MTKQGPPVAMIRRTAAVGAVAGYSPRLGNHFAPAALPRASKKGQNR